MANPHINVTARCSVQACGKTKGQNNHWFVLLPGRYTHLEGIVKRPIVALFAWDEMLLQQESAMPVCGEECASKKISEFMNGTRQEPGWHTPPEPENFF